MPLPLILTALFVLQDPQTPVQTPTTAPTAAPVQAPLAPDFPNAPSVAEPMRMALTPKLDGAIDPEEWDPLTSSPTVKSYFQWEPGKLHVAATVPDGNDVLVSVDLKANGWLVGKDNLEVRIGMAGGMPKVSGRLLDAMRVDGPHWIDLPGVAMASKVAAKSQGGVTTYEVSISDADYGLIPVREGKISVRVDGIGSASPTIEPFIPRVLAPATLTMSRAAALPPSLRWDVDGQGSTTVAGEGVKLRFKFNGTDKLGLQRFAMRTEGLAKSATSDGSVPFPVFDNKGRAFVDYQTPVARDAETGYRIAQGALTAADGVPGVIEASYRIAPPIELSMDVEKIQSKPATQTVRLSYEVGSNSLTTRRIDGNVKINPPQGCRVMDGDDRDFSLFGARGRVRRVYNLEIPAGASGVFPIVYRVACNGKIVEFTDYVNVE